MQTLGDLCGFGINYFDLENVGYVKTATEVSADNSALMRNIRRHEHALEGAIAGICRSLLAVERRIGVGLPDEGGIRVTFDDSIITDTTAEKRQDMDEVAAGLMEPWEYRAKWHGEGEVAARRGGASGGSAASRGGSDGGDAAPRPRQGPRGALARHGVARDGVRLARGRVGIAACGRRALGPAAAVRQREAPAAPSVRDANGSHTPQPPANVKKNVAARPP